MRKFSSPPCPHHCISSFQSHTDSQPGSIPYLELPLEKGNLDYSADSFAGK